MAPSFPTSKYARYKRATAFFLDWLLRARGRGRQMGGCVELDAFSDVVRDIAREPTSLTPRLLSQLPKALAACQCAITLREHVSAFFAADGRASERQQQSHQHFLELLKSWHSALLTVEQQQGDDTAQSRKFENYYEVLQVDEDFFPDEQSLETQQDKDTPKSVKQHRAQLFNEAFAEDLRLEAVYFFLELEELVEGVFTVYDQVKKQQRTMVEATVAVKLAMENAQALTARLQLRYPALKTAEDFITIVMDRAPANFMMQAATAVTNFWESFQRNGTYQFAPGMLLIDFISVGSTLMSFTSAIPTEARTTMILRDGFFGENYGEERTPQYVLPDHSNMVVFLLQQLPLLYNQILVTKAATGMRRYQSSGLAGSFMVLMDEYFTSRKVTVPVVFACICWLKSVAALQGNGGLSRNVSLTFKHSTELMKNMEATVAKRAVHTADQEIHDILKNCAGEIKQSSRIHNLARYNPLMAGLLMLDYHLQYLHAAGEVLMVTSRFRAFGHLYNALVQQGFVRRIPFFDDVLEIYDQMIFTPSREAAVHGSYNRTYLLSSHMTATSVDAMYRGVTPPAGREGVKVRTALHQRDLSKIFRLITEDDKSVLGGVSSKAMLCKAADICSQELFESRVLSRDMLKLNDDLTDAFTEMCDALGRRQYHDEYIARHTPGESRQYRINRALEDAVMMHLIPLMDALQEDGTLDLRALPAGNRIVQAGVLDGEEVRVMCRKVAAVITAKFATPSLVCEQKYFTFSSRPDFVDQEFGTASFKKWTKGKNREQTFSDLMDLLEESEGPLSSDEMNYIKAEIKKDPELLVMVSLCTVSGTDPSTFDPTDFSQATRDDLCSLLHQAAAGPAHDAGLVEFMIQLGALNFQPAIHCRKEPRQRDLRMPRKMLCNTMAVHSAAIAGHEDIVRIILEADNLLDLNTPTYHTKETLAHLAVKYGHRSMYELLALFGADLRIKDGHGRRVCDVTSDRTWARKIEASIAVIERSQARCEGARPRDGVFRHESNVRADRMRQSISTQRDEERRRAFENAVGSNKKKGKKGKRGKKGKAKGTTSSAPTQSAPVDESAEVTDLLKSLLLSDSKSSDTVEGSSEKAILGDTLANTAAIFARLRDPTIPANDKTEDVQRACAAIERLEGLVEVLSHPSRLNSTDRGLRAAVSAESCQVIHMMQKLHRVDHAAIAVPALASVRKLCDTDLTFAKFVVGAARLGTSIDRKPQAREVLELLEKRLLKMPFAKRKPSEFRQLVETYSESRNAMGLGRSCTPDTFRNLEWYLSSAVDDNDAQVKLDAMAGSPFYCAFTTNANNRQFYAFVDSMYARPDLGGVACFGTRARHVVYGGSSEEDVARVRSLLMDEAARQGVQFTDRGSQPCTPTVQVGKFTFSAAGIVADAAAA